MAAVGADAGVQQYSPDIEEVRQCLLNAYNDSQDRVNAIFHKVFRPHKIKEAIAIADDPNPNIRFEHRQAHYLGYMHTKYKVKLFAESDPLHRTDDKLAFRVELMSNGGTQLLYRLPTPGMYMGRPTRSDVLNTSNSLPQSFDYEGKTITYYEAVFRYSKNHIIVEVKTALKPDSDDYWYADAAFVDLCNSKP